MSRGGLRTGAGRPGWHAKAEHCLRLDIRALARRGLLVDGGFSWKWTDTDTSTVLASITVTVMDGTVTASYTANGRPVRQVIPVVRTGCNFGGDRPWFRCPCCGRRAAVLYLRGELFRCRHCGRIVYASQSDDAIGRGWRQQYKLESRLGDYWARPKGMHRQTHARLLQRIWACEQARDEVIERFLARFPNLVF